VEESDFYRSFGDIKDDDYRYSNEYGNDNYGDDNYDIDNDSDF
jgi:hypothetical protein